MAKRENEIRRVATSYEGTMVAFSEFKKTIHVVDLASGSHVASFDLELDSGGSRLAIDPANSSCAAASFRNGSVTLADLSGSVRWKRENLDGIQRVQFSNDGTRLYCVHNRVLSQLDVRTGRQVPFNMSEERCAGTRQLRESPFGERLVLDRYDADIQVTTKSLKNVCQLRRKSFAVLDFAFTPDRLAITESGGPISCYDLATTRELWTLSFPAGIHAIDLDYNEDANCFVAVSWPFEKGGKYRLLAITSDTGEIVRETVLRDGVDFGFANRGSRLITTTGRVFNSSSGEQSGSLAIRT
ncbi:MAG: hypothetical protein AAGG48_04755 [Planctomycetota bacterium]